MSRLIVIAASIVSFAALAGSSANAQSALSSCNPATGLGPNGQPCVTLIPKDPSAITAAPIGAEGGEQYGTLDTSTLGQTYECRQANANDVQSGVGGVLLIENCGPPAQLSNVKPFFGTTGAPAPAPLPAAPAPAPVAALPPPPPPPPAPIAVPAAPPVFAPVQAAGLGGSIIPLAIGAAGLAAVVGIAIAVDDDDDNSANSTTGTQ